MNYGNASVRNTHNILYLKNLSWRIHKGFLVCLLPFSAVYAILNRFTGRRITQQSPSVCFGKAGDGPSGAVHPKTFI